MLASSSSSCSVAFSTQLHYMIWRSQSQVGVNLLGFLPIPYAASIAQALVHIPKGYPRDQHACRVE